jgi:predicted transcriptional regulator
MKALFKFLQSIETEIPVKDIMITNIITVNQDDPAYKAVEYMSKYHIGGLIIIDSENKPVGIVSEGDLLQKIFLKRLDPKKIRIQEIMTGEILTIPYDKSIGASSLLMRQKHISKLPVMKDGKIVGIVTKHDLAEKLNDIYRQNRRLVWSAVINVAQFFIIALLVLALIKR